MFRNGYFNTGIKALNSKSFELAFRKFLEREEQYRMRFLQKNFKKSIDGYSFLGQKDSLNQYDYDQLHSFVLSRFNSLESFPDELKSVLKTDWEEVESLVCEIENGILAGLEDGHLSGFYKSYLGHNMSANYYPVQTNEFKQRLSSHKDVSMFTVFPFGVDSDLQFLSKNQWVSAKSTEEIIVIPGYLLEKISDGKIKGVEHRVLDGGSKNKERFSFAMFSIPIPEKMMVLNGQEMSAEDYMNEYLNLFE